MDEIPHARAVELTHSRLTFRAVTYGISRNTASLKLSFLNGSLPQRPGKGALIALFFARRSYNYCELCTFMSGP
jgi:hypothetical protein